MTKIKNLPVPVPPQAEQAKIVERIEERLVQLRHVRDASEAILKRGKGLRNALLRKAFEGGLVPQDPNETPASDVLARVTAEQAAQPKARRTRKATAKKAAVPRAARPASPAPEPTPAPALAVQQEFDL